MDYSRTSILDLFAASYSRQEDMGKLSTPAQFWVEAENVHAVRQILIDWFGAMEEGVVENRYPDPTNDAVTQEWADHLVEELDADFESEKGRWIGLGVEAGPAYSRLSSHARLAFAQEIDAILLDDDEIIWQAKRRLKAGEAIPPLEASPDYVNEYWYD